MFFLRDRNHEEMVQRKEKHAEQTSMPVRIAELRKRNTRVRAHLDYLTADRLNHTYSLVGRIDRASPVATAKASENVTIAPHGRQR